MILCKLKKQSQAKGTVTVVIKIPFINFNNMVPTYILPLKLYINESNNLISISMF